MGESGPKNPGAGIENTKRDILTALRNALKKDAAGRFSSASLNASPEGMSARSLARVINRDPEEVKAAISTLPLGETDPTTNLVNLDTMYAAIQEALETGQAPAVKLEQKLEKPPREKKEELNGELIRKMIVDFFSKNLGTPFLKKQIKEGVRLPETSNVIKTFNYELEKLIASKTLRFTMTEIAHGGKGKRRVEAYIMDKAPEQESSSQE